MNAATTTELITPTRRAFGTATAMAIYIAAIVAANIMTNRLGLVPIGFGLLVTAGTFAAGFALLARDGVQRYGGLPYVFAGITAGAALSWVFATPQLAVASCVAFTSAELADLLVFTRLEHHGFVPAALTSNLASAPLDTVAFLWLAGFPLTVHAIVGQFLAKIVIGTMLPLGILMLVRRRVVLR
jgi:queuosine precursor transporter